MCLVTVWPLRSSPNSANRTKGPRPGVLEKAGQDGDGRRLPKCQPELPIRMSWLGAWGGLEVNKW